MWTVSGSPQLSQTEHENQEYNFAPNYANEKHFDGVQQNNSYY